MMDKIRIPRMPDDYYGRIKTGLQLRYTASYDALSKKMWLAYACGLEPEERKEINERFMHICNGTSYSRDSKRYRH
jgi:hypothetical protein